MMETISTGIAALALACLGYLIRKAVKNKALASFLSDTLEQILYEKAIQAAEVWGKNMEQKLQQKVEGSQKMQKAVQEVKDAISRLNAMGIKVNIDVDEDTLKSKLQEVFDKMKAKLHSAD
jgi:outer membrane protein OmpA-like peptidoglycan-associated protein